MSAPGSPTTAAGGDGGKTSLPAALNLCYVQIRRLGMPSRCSLLGGSATQGLLFVTAGSISFVAFVYAAVVSKLLPRSDNAFISAVQKDRYYCFLVPFTLPILVVAVYFHWLSMKLFKHA